MNKFLLVATYCITLFYTAHAQYQTHWGKSITSSDDFRITDMCVDNSGNVYTIGTFDGTMDLDPGPGVYNITGPLNISRSHVFLQKLDASGNFVRVRHDDGSEAVYLHLKQGSVSVRVGQRVAVGSPLALSGNTGNSSGPHLHFVVQRATEAGLVSIPYEFNQPVGALPNFALGN